MGASRAGHREQVNVFEVDGVYLFKHYFDGAERHRQVTGSVLSAIDDLLAADRAAVFRHTAPANRLEVVDTTSDPGAAGAVPLDSDHPLARAFVTGRLFEGADASRSTASATASGSPVANSRRS